MSKSLEELFSIKRLEAYDKVGDRDSEGKILRYNFNIELSRAFYPPLHILEVSIRNNLHIAFAEYLKDPTWLMNYKNHSLIHKREQKKIEDALNELSKKKKPIEEGRIIAELNFGFWVNLFDRPYTEVHLRTGKNQFPNATAPQRNIAKLRTELNQIRFLRNRIFHYEPIWHWNNLEVLFLDIKQIINYMKKELSLESFVESEKEILRLIEKKNRL